MHLFYYHVKPFLPWWLKTAVRRSWVKRKREAYRDVWPISPLAGRAPDGWPGWPEGKKFALVLTHDVEGEKGLACCRDLMKLEMEMGFRSSFNFVPARYHTPRELRDELTSNGFEVGVHDLRHDGKLYSSKKAFSANARHINGYLRQWNAVGFRSAFMLRNLDWIHELNIQYDSSTFDTDPFEPQPDGVSTIFPFWVPRIRNSEVRSQSSDLASPLRTRPSSLADGYVELPYTLPQDSTLFLLFREQSINIWKQKLDWIVQKGGMALVDVHPDYLYCGEGTPNARQYSSSYYKAFLEYVSEKYDGEFWHALPQEVAKWYTGASRSRREMAPRAPTKLWFDSPLKGKRAAVLLYSYYPSDPRPRREAEALVGAGMQVDLICLRENDSEPTKEVIGGVNILRLPVQKKRESKFAYMRQYSTFLATCALLLAARTARKRYDLVHVHNMPDVLVFSALVPKLLGARIVLDLHDPMPELMMTIFDLQEETFGVRLLKRTEKLSIWFADAVLTVNRTIKDIFASRSCSENKISVVMNSPDETIFSLKPLPPFAEAAYKADRPFVVMYHGSLVERHGLDIALRALVKVRVRIPKAELRIYGHRTPFLDRVLKMAENQDLRDAVHYFGPKNLEQIVLAIGECDVGVIPNRRSIFTEINTPTRIFEYLSQGKPVIAPSARGIRDYFNDDDIIFFDLGDVDDLAQKIEFVHQNPVEVREIVERGQAVYRTHMWEEERSRFIQVVEGLLNDGALATSTLHGPNGRQEWRRGFP